MAAERTPLTFLLRAVPALVLVSLVAWCNVNSKARQKAEPLKIELLEIFANYGMASSGPSVNLENTAKIMGPTGMSQMLYESATNASFPAIKWMIDHGADPKNIGSPDGKTTLLQRLAKTPRYDKLEYFLGLGLDAKERTPDGRSLMHIAAEGGLDERVIGLLRARGLSITDVDNTGRQPIHFANIKSISALSTAGADLNAMDKLNRTPLHNAALEGRADAVTELIRRGASLFSRDNRGRTPLHLAAMGPSAETIDALIDAGALISDQDDDGLTPGDLAKIRNSSYRWRSKSDRLNGTPVQQR